MGTICESAYANIFLENLKNYIFTPTLDIFQHFTVKLQTIYIFLWSETKSEPIKFIDNLNKKHPTINFEFTYSRNSITFLDTKVCKIQNGTLCTTIYRKESDHHDFYHCKLAHPKTLKDYIPHSQALHIKRICSKTSEVIKHVKGLKDICFYQWGYQSKILDYHLERAMSVDQKIRLENKEKLYVKTLKSRNNQDIVHHALQD